jgi:hypothetical protein
MRPSIYLKNLQSSSNWRAQYNPLRGLTLPLLVALLEGGERGDYARLQWLYRFIEKRNPTLARGRRRRCRGQRGGGVYLDDSPLYAKVGALGRGQGLELGGDWTSFADEPHFQLPWGGSLAQARVFVAAGNWKERWA